MARKTRRTFTKEFKLEVVREIDAGASVAQAARTHNVPFYSVTVPCRNAYEL